jgi:uncharacterized membrane protein YjgN (DUF898 family)
MSVIRRAVRFDAALRDVNSIRFRFAQCRSVPFVVAHAGVLCSRETICERGVTAPFFSIFRNSAHFHIQTDLFGKR